MSTSELKKTPLHALHLELKARMVPFAGYDMPVQYQAGIKQEHLHTRAQAGLFDVSHMGQFLIQGKDAIAELEKLIPVDLHSLADNAQTYGAFTNASGGILDDLIICRWSEDCFYLVVNAACKDQDLEHLRQHLTNLDIQNLDDRALLALQGPAAKGVMAEIAPDINITKLIFMTSTKCTIAGVECYISRSGYTGEDGFEISVPASAADALARQLLNFEQVEAIGLGARDTLRLEAGLCLYGHDMNTDTTLVEAGLSWSIAKSRRSSGSKAGGFPGANEIFIQMIDGTFQKQQKQRVGLLVEGRRIIREGSEIYDADNHIVGIVTSGGYSPTLEAPIAMAYIKTEIITSLTTQPTTIHAKVRDTIVPVNIHSMPFIPHHYFRG